MAMMRGRSALSAYKRSKLSRHFWVQYRASWCCTIIIVMSFNSIE